MHCCRYYEMLLDLLAEVGLIRSAHKTATSAFKYLWVFGLKNTGARLPLVLGTALAGMSFVLLGSSTGF